MQWCGLCNEYTDHDTAHHATGGGIGPGDQVKVIFEGREFVGRVEEVRGKRAKVAFSLSRGRTENTWIDREGAERIGA